MTLATLKDCAGRDMAVGDFIVYAEDKYLQHGYITRLNANTDRLWVKPCHHDRRPEMKMTYDRTLDKWVETDEERGVSLLVHTMEYRFQIL